MKKIFEDVQKIYFLKETRVAFDDAIVITAHGYDKKFIEDFELRLNKVTGVISTYVSFFGFWL